MGRHQYSPSITSLIFDMDANMLFDSEAIICLLNSLSSDLERNPFVLLITTDVASFLSRHGTYPKQTAIEGIKEKMHGQIQVAWIKLDLQVFFV